MRKIFWCCALLFITLNVVGQEPEYLQFQAPGHQINNSIFSNIEVADTRFDDVYMGFVQKGAFNRKAPIKLQQPISEEIKQFAATLMENAVKENGTVLINIRDFFLSEAEKATSEIGTFVFKAGCYLRDGDQYNFMFAVDTTIVLKSGWDVTKRLEKTSSEQLFVFIKRAAEFNKSSVQNTAYSYADLLDINTKEKAMIPVYNVELPQKGLYKDFEAFKQNQPTDTSFIEEFNKKNNNPSFYLIKPDNTKGKAVISKDYYAICDGNQLYFTTINGTYVATKKDGDFYFTGRGKDATNATVSSSAYMMFGLLGGLVASIPAQATFEYKIDFKTGQFLPVRKVSN